VFLARSKRFLIIFFHFFVFKQKKKTTNNKTDVENGREALVHAQVRAVQLPAVPEHFRQHGRKRDPRVVAAVVQAGH
jgi:hypothetical protein